MEPTASGEAAESAEPVAGASAARWFARDAHAFGSLLDQLGIVSPAGAGELPEDAFVLVAREDALDLRPPGEAARPGIQATLPPDFASSPRRSRRSHRAHPLVRAFGSRVTQVLDATAGLGADAYRLAESGLSVRAFERHPVVYALLVSAWDRAQARALVPEAVAARLELVWGDAADAVEIIRELDVGVYLDPMYPAPRKRSALPKRELQVLRQLLGEGTAEAARLLERARERAARVVVKRPHHAPPLAPGASFQLESKLVRFDVYTNPARMAGGAS